MVEELDLKNLAKNIKLWKNPSHDKLFKIIMSDKEILKDFINSYFEFKGENIKVKRVNVIAQKLISSNSYFSKDYYGDICVTLDNKDRIFIEMSNNFREYDYNKAFEYLLRKSSKIIKKSAGYTNIPKVRGLILMRGNFHYDESNLINVRKFCDVTGIYVKDVDEMIGLDLVNIDNCKTYKYNEFEKRFINWLKFFNSKNISELINNGKDDRIMEKAAKLHIDALIDDDFADLIEDSEIKLRMEKAESRNEGRAAEKQDIAKTMISLGETIDKIMAYTGLSKKEIKQLML